MSKCEILVGDDCVCTYTDDAGSVWKGAGLRLWTI